MGDAIEEWLAKPLGTKKFKSNYVVYKQPDYSDHKQYIIFITAEDLARIDMLMLNEDKWKAKQASRQHHQDLHQKHLYKMKSTVRITLTVLFYKYSIVYFLNIGSIGLPIQPLGSWILSKAAKVAAISAI